MPGRRSADVCTAPQSVSADVGCRSRSPGAGAGAAQPAAGAGAAQPAPAQPLPARPPPAASSTRRRSRHGTLWSVLPSTVAGYAPSDSSGRSASWIRRSSALSPERASASRSDKHGRIDLRVAGADRRVPGRPYESLGDYPAKPGFRPTGPEPGACSADGRRRSRRRSQTGPPQPTAGAGPGPGIELVSFGRGYVTRIGASGSRCRSQYRPETSHRC